MSRKLVLQIANNQLAEAKETLNEALVEIMAAKLHEKKKMIAAGAINESESTTVRSGFLKVSHKKDAVHIAFTGNSGQNEGDVEKAFDRLHGPGTFAKVRPHGEFHKDNAGNVHKHASYSYVLKVPKKKFNSELGIKDVAAHYASMNAKSDTIMKDTIKRAVDDQKEYEKKKGKMDEGVLNKVKRAWNKIGQAKRLGAKIDSRIASNDKVQADAGREYKEARKKLDASAPGSARQMLNWDKVISASKREADAAATAARMVRRSGRVAGFPSFKRKNPKGLAEGNNPDAKLTMQGKRDRIQNMHNDLHRGHPDVTPADEASVQRMIDKRKKSLKSIKEGRLSAKEASDIAVKTVTDRTKASEKARLKRKNDGYPARGSDNEGITPSGTETKAKKAFSKWREKDK